MQQNRHYQRFWFMCKWVGGFGFGLDIGAHNFKFSDTDWIWSLWKNFESNPTAKFPYQFTTGELAGCQRWAWAWPGSWLDILQDTGNFSDQDWIWIFIFEKNWIRTGSGYWFDFYNEIFPRVIQDVTNDGGSIFFAMFFILSVCAALITINGNSCYFIVNVFRPSGCSELLLCCWYAALFVVQNGICVCCAGW